MKSLLVCTCLSLLIVGAAIAGNGGSAYSRFGLGDLRFAGSARTAAMGTSGIAVFAPADINRANPATWGAVRGTRFSIGALYEGYATRDTRGAVFLSGVRFDNVAIAVPIATRHGIVFSAGFAPHTRVDYNLVSPPISQTGLDYTIEYEGDGGVSLAHAGLSISPASDVSFGIKLDYYFGTIEHTLRQQFAQGQFTNSGVIRATELRGLGGTAGLGYGGASRIFGLPRGHSLNVGFVASTSANLTATEERYYTYTTTRSTRDTAISEEYSIRLPVRFGAGLAYQTDRFVLAADAHFQDWSELTVGGSKVPEIRNSQRFSVGWEILPQRGPDASALERWAYRVGAFYYPTYYRLRGQSIDEFGATGGVGIPIFGETRLDVGLSYSVRGTTEQQLTRDRIVRLSFSLNTGEVWFVRPAEE